MNEVEKPYKLMHIWVLTSIRMLTMSHDIFRSLKLYFPVVSEYLKP